MRTENRHREIIRQNAADPQKDSAGSASGSLADDLRFFGIADFLMKLETPSFRSQLAASARIRLRLLERFDAGEPIDGSYVTMLAYKDLFDALAAADLAAAQQLAQRMGGRDRLEKEHDHPFDYAMGYTLRAFVLKDEEAMAHWPDVLAEACEKTRSRDFLGYAKMFRAMNTRDVGMANEGLKEIVVGHKRQSKGGGVFAGMEDEVISIWGIGMANLARHHYGLAVQAVPPLIPAELLV